MVPRCGGGVCHLACFLLLRPDDNSCAPERALNPLALWGCHLSLLPSRDAAWLRKAGSPRGSSSLSCHQSERSLLGITTGNLCNTLHCCRWSSEQRTGAGINPGLSHGNGSITSGPNPKDFILLRHKGRASLHPASLSFSSSRDKVIAKELKKASPANTQAEPLVKLRSTSETCWVELLGVDRWV